MEILAVVTLDRTRVGGGAPIFYAQDQEELSELAFRLSRVLGASVHDLQNGVLVIIRH